MVDGRSLESVSSRPVIGSMYSFFHGKYIFCRSEVVAQVTAQFIKRKETVTMDHG